MDGTTRGLPLKSIFHFLKISRLIIFLCSFSPAQWMPNGVPVCDTSANSGFYMLPEIASDDSGGAYIVWRDGRAGNFDVYAQRIGPDGKTLWTRQGIPLVQDSATQWYPRIISDGRGGAFIAWEDDRSVVHTEIYAQRIDRRGQSLWQLNGVKVAETPGLFISLADHEQGGILVAWNANYGASNDVVVQRLDSMGNRMWPDSGVRISSRAGAIYAGDVVAIGDGSGGGYVAWSEGEYQFEKLYMQHIGADGSLLWPSNGIEVAGGLFEINVGMSPDPAGGAIVSWSNMTSDKEFVQRINPSGQRLWGSSGLDLGDLTGGGGQSQTGRRHTKDGKGGAFVGHSRWIQRIDSTGSKVWGDEGGTYTTVPSNFSNSIQVHDQKQGVFNFWTNYGPSPGLTDIYMQYVDSSGIPRSGPDGTVICAVQRDQDWPDATTDGRGGAIVVWDDFRNNHGALYAAHVNSVGIITSAHRESSDPRPATPHLLQNYPNPFNPRTTIEYEIPERGHVRVTIYDSLGKEVSELVDEIQSAGVHNVFWDGRNSQGERVSTGVYYFRIVVDDVYQTTRKSVLLK